METNIHGVSMDTCFGRFGVLLGVVCGHFTDSLLGKNGRNHCLKLHIPAIKIRNFRTFESAGLGSLLVQN
jgi:hypothetical protein